MIFKKTLKVTKIINKTPKVTKILKKTKKRLSTTTTKTLRNFNIKMIVLSVTTQRASLRFYQ